MSVRASSWAWESSAATGSAFLVLLALADHAGADGGDAWPSVGRLARRCRVDERTVRRAIATLTELGEVEVEHNAGPHGTNRYRLTLRTGSATLRLEPVDNPGDNPAEDPGHLALPPGDVSADPGHGVRQPRAPRPPNRKEPSKNQPPTPTGSAAGAPDVVHDGRHPSCRACGTNPRAQARPLDPAEAAVAAGAAIVELNDRRRRGDVCPSCEGSGWVLDEANLAHPCPPCQEARALP